MALLVGIVHFDLVDLCRLTTIKVLHTVSHDFIATTHSYHVTHFPYILYPSPHPLPPPYRPAPYRHAPIRPHPSRV